MTSIRFDVITDDVNVAPRMSRILPATLYNTITNDTFHTFCNHMDTLLMDLDTDQRRRTKRFWLMYYAINIWIFISIFFIPSFITYGMSNHSVFESMVSILIWVGICIIHFGTVWICTAPPAGTKTNAETMRDIRLECEAMTSKTPGVSFHLVLVPTATRGTWLQMNTIDHVSVNVATTGFFPYPPGTATVGMEQHDNGTTTTNVPHVDVQQPPMVHPKASTITTNDDYQQLV